MSEQGKKRGALDESVFQALAGFVGSTGQAGDVALNDGRVLRVIPLAKLRPDPNQVRTLGTLESLREAAATGDVAATRELASLDEMAASIREVGLQEPLGVEVLAEGDYLVVHGHRRHLALQLAEVREAPCVVWTQLPQSLRIRLQLVENKQREDLGEAEVYDAMAAYKRALAAERGVAEEQVTWAEVATTCGMTNENRKRIARLRRLAPAAYAVAKRARLTEWVLRPLLQYLQRSEGEEQDEERRTEVAAVLEEEAQQRIVLAVAAEEERTAAMTLALLRVELGQEGPEELPEGRSAIGLRFERRWSGWDQDFGRLRARLGDLTADDRAALRDRAGQLRGELETLLQELEG